MTLTIPNNSNLDADDLIEFFIKKIQNYVETNINNEELSRWDEYLHKASIKWGTLGNKQTIPSTRDIILGAIYNLTYNKFTNKYIIEIDENVNIPNTSVKYSSMINLINYGNLSINGYDIVDKAFSDIINNFLVYIDEYSEEI